MKWLLAIILIPASLGGPCLKVDGDQVLASDLAKSVAGFARLDPTSVIAPAPFPGVRRIFAVRELRAIAELKDIQLDDAADLCVERATAPLTEDQIRSAMLRGLGLPGAQIELVDFIRQAVPSGELEFPARGLTRPSSARADSSLLWRGTLLYSPRHTLAVWALVRLSAELDVVVAKREIVRGSVISAGDLALTRKTLSPLADRLTDPDQAIGRAAKKTIAPGAALFAGDLDAPFDIARGDVVRVLSQNGAASISMDAIAQAPGRKKDRIALLNPETHRVFRAVVDGPARAHVGIGAL